jgi:hypothetical protein
MNRPITECAPFSGLPMVGLGSFAVQGSIDWQVSLLNEANRVQSDRVRHSVPDGLPVEAVNLSHLPQTAERLRKAFCKVLARRGLVHILGQDINAIAGRAGRKMDPTADFAIFRTIHGSALQPEHDSI